MELMSYYGVAVDTPTICREPSKTRQSELEGSDINVIMKRYEKTGLLPVNVREALFMDVSEVGDYRTAVAVVAEAEGMFRQLPAELRAQFDNDPAAFVDFCSDPGNREQLELLGLVEKAQEKAPVAPEAAKSA